ncbi:MAG: SURF1 family protein [Rhizobiaceae bacterium]|nr:SURF1 family protein [Rhizobiaceae bacterium]
MKLTNVILVVAIALGVIFLSGLGAWQIKRLAWKEGLIARVETNLSSPPLSFEEVQITYDRGEDIEYRPMRVSGVFDHAREQHFYATHKGNPGYFVYTPLKLDADAYVFVNRGYVPLQKKSADTRAPGQITGRQEIEGLARSAPQSKPNTFVPENDLHKNIYYWKSLAQMKVQAFGDETPNVVPFFVDAGDAPNPQKLPVGGVTRIEFSNSHLQYALTWFGLAGALLVVGGFFLFGRIRTNS